jgi:hypothetical protein
MPRSRIIVATSSVDTISRFRSSSVTTWPRATVVVVGVAPLLEDEPSESGPQRRRDARELGRGRRDSVFPSGNVSLRGSIGQSLREHPLRDLRRRAPASQ